MRVIGKPFTRIDAAAKCTGETKFADDIVLPRMLHAKILRSTMAHARIVRIDASKAKRHPGVKAVLLGKDIPAPNQTITTVQDQHALACEKVRMVGDGVAALDEDTASEAQELSEVEYEPLRVISTIQDALYIRA